MSIIANYNITTTNPEILKKAMADGLINLIHVVSCNDSFTHFNYADTSDIAFTQLCRLYPNEPMIMEESWGECIYKRCTYVNMDGEPYEVSYVVSDYLCDDEDNCLDYFEFTITDGVMEKYPELVKDEAVWIQSFCHRQHTKINITNRKHTSYETLASKGATLSSEDLLKDPTFYEVLARNTVLRCRRIVRQ